MRLTAKKILDKKFENVINGYSPTKVDQYLDMIIQDYKEMEEKIKSLEQEVEELKNLKQNVVVNKEE